ncbi:helix-turn-helix domain-containing protein [Enterococcus faecalis]
MLKEQLLDNYEKKELLLLDTLYIGDGLVEKQQLLDTLNISEKNLKRTIASVHERLSRYVSTPVIEYRKGAYELSKEGRINMGRVSSQYAATSINYLIIRAYLEKESVQPELLIDSLLISRSDLHRRIKIINQVIQEFDLQIKYNKLRGTELQIRYFEQLISQHIFLEDDLAEMEKTTNSFQLLFDALESYYCMELEDIQKDKLSLWFANLLKNRKMTRGTTIIPAHITQYLTNNPHYGDFVDILINFFNRYAIQLSDIDKASTYLFSLSFFVMPFSSKKTREIIDFSLERQDIVGVIIQWMIEKMEHSLTDETTSVITSLFYLYYMFNFHSQTIFFSGYLFYVDAFFIDFYQNFNYNKEPVVRNWINQLCEEPNFQQTCLCNNKEFLFYKYMLMVYQEKSFIVSPMQVGVSLFTDPLMEQILIDRLQKELSKNHSVHVECYQKDHVYDLVVVNIPNQLKKKNYELEFVVSSIGTTRDKQEIGKKLTELQRKRLAST